MSARRAKSRIKMLRGARWLILGEGSPRFVRPICSEANPVSEETDKSGCWHASMAASSISSLSPCMVRSVLGAKPRHVYHPIYLSQRLAFSKRIMNGLRALRSRRIVFQRLTKRIPPTLVERQLRVSYIAHLSASPKQRHLREGGQFSPPQPCL
jgi:hypothetical protein